MSTIVKEGRTSSPALPAQGSRDACTAPSDFWANVPPFGNKKMRINFTRISVSLFFNDYIIPHRAAAHHVSKGFILAHHGSSLQK